MKIALLVDCDKLRRAHRFLAERLQRRFPDGDVALRVVKSELPLPAAVGHLLNLERIAYRRGRETLCDPLKAEEFGPPSETNIDVAIDLSSREAECVGATLTLRPLFDGAIGEAALIGSLIAGRLPRVSIENAATHEVLANGSPSLEAADGLTGGLEAVYSRVLVLIEQALRNPGQSAPHLRFEPADLSRSAVARYALSNLSWSAVRALYHFGCYAPHWRIGWRFNDGPGVLDLGDLDGPTWNVLADRGYESFADPFIMSWRGRTCLFFEALDHRTNKGTIGAVEIGPNGPIGRPFSVIEEPWHLSYPFLIEAEGDLWMIPEASVSRKVWLYRCVEFPYRWERRDPLLEGVEAADATIFRQGDYLYMTSVVRDGYGGYSDTLAIHYATSLFGPWRPHALTPVLVDGAAARPAGAVVRRADALWRPVQDCSRGYGRALRLARIDRISPEAFEQTFVAQVGPGPMWPGGRLHTVNRMGRLEAIDGVVVTPKLSMLRRAMETRSRPAPRSATAPSPVLS